MRPAVAALAAMCFTLVLHLCSTPSIQAQSVCTGEVATADETLVVRSGQPVDVALNTQPGTGYNWTIATDPDPAVVVLQDSQVLPAQTALPGATQQACFHFTAVGVGTTQAEFVSARPFEPDAPAQTITLTFSVLQRQPPVQLPRVSVGTQ